MPGDRQMRERRALIHVGERGQDGLAETALGPVVLDDHDRARGGGSLPQPLLVDRLDGVAVEDPRRDSVCGKRLGGGERLVHRDAGADDRDLVLVGGRAPRGCRRPGTPRPAS